MLNVPVHRKSQWSMMITHHQMSTDAHNTKRAFPSFLFAVNVVQ